MPEGERYTYYLSSDYKTISVLYHIYSSVLYIAPYFLINFIKRERVPGFINMIFYATQINGICIILIPIYIEFIRVLVHIGMLLVSSRLRLTEQF